METSHRTRQARFMSAPRSPDVSTQPATRPPSCSAQARRGTGVGSTTLLGRAGTAAGGAPATLEAWETRVEQCSRPRVDFLATGGTIASVQNERQVGATPTLTAEVLAKSAAGIDEIAELTTVQVMQRPSPSITFRDLLGLRDEIEHRLADGAAGVVVTQGTDTMEETAFALDLLCLGEAPIVFTGAMRNPSRPGADGPANLLAAVQVAASTQARRLGALVVMNDEIHGARFVAKAHTSSLAAFQSRPAGPLGWVSEGRTVIAARPAGRFHVHVPSDTDVPPVALIRLGFDDDGRVLPALAGLGFRGAVIEGFGGGHVTPRMVPLVEHLAREMPVVLASRTGSGETLQSTYRYPGSEIELLELGLIPAGALNGLKARLLLSLCLAANLPSRDIAGALEAIGMTSRPET
jgi:L-asparaginase